MSVRQRPALSSEPLLVAAKEGRDEEVRRLVASGEVNLCAVSEEQETALHAVCQHPHDCIECCKLLLQAGIEVNAATTLGYTALHYAARTGAVGVVTCLLSRGASVLATTQYGDTPLHWACQEANQKIVKLLINQYQDNDQIHLQLTTKNKAGHTPIHLVKACGSMPGLADWLDLILKQTSGTDTSRNCSLGVAYAKCPGVGGKGELQFNEGNIITITNKPTSCQWEGRVGDGPVGWIDVSSCVDTSFVPIDLSLPPRRSDVQQLYSQADVIWSHLAELSNRHAAVSDIVSRVTTSRHALEFPSKWVFQIRHLPPLSSCDDILLLGFVKLILSKQCNAIISPSTISSHVSSYGQKSPTSCMTRGDSSTRCSTTDHEKTVCLSDVVRDVDAQKHLSEWYELSRQGLPFHSFSTGFITKFLEMMAAILVYRLSMTPVHLYDEALRAVGSTVSLLDTSWFAPAFEHLVKLSTFATDKNHQEKATLQAKISTVGSFVPDLVSAETLAVCTACQLMKTYHKQIAFLSAESARKLAEGAVLLIAQFLHNDVPAALQSCCATSRELVRGIVTSHCSSRLLEFLKRTNLSFSIEALSANETLVSRRWDVCGLLRQSCLKTTQGRKYFLPGHINGLAVYGCHHGTEEDAKALAMMAV